MEVSPEIYAWLSALNIIEPFNETNRNGMSNYFISENTLNSLFNGEYIELLIYDLQEAYNKYFQIRKDCSLKLKELVFKEKNFDKISEKTKLNNWNVINDALKIFGMKFSKNDLNKIVNGNNAVLLKILTNIFNTITQYLKYAKKDNKKENNDLNKSKNIRDKNNLNLNLNFSKNKNQNITLNESNSNNKLIQKENSSSILNTCQNEVLKNIITESNNISNNININENYINKIFSNNSNIK